MGGIFSSYEDVKKEEEEEARRRKRSVKREEEKVDSGKKVKAGVVDELAWKSHFSCSDVKSLTLRSTH